MMSDESKPLDPRLLEILACPKTKGTLLYDPQNQELISETAGLAYPIRGQVPIMLVEEARVIAKPAKKSKPQD